MEIRLIYKFQIMKFYVIALFFTVLGCQAKQKELVIEKPDYLETYASDQLKQDLTSLKSELEKYHAGLYRYTSKGELNKVFDQVMNNLDHDMDQVGYYRLIAPYVAKINCGHTRMRLPEVVRTKVQDNELFLPFKVKIIDEKIYVLEYYGKEEALAPGMEILGINNHSIEQIRENVFASLPSDGFIETSKLRYWERDFSYLYTLLMELSANEYQLTIKDTTQVRTVIVEGIQFEEIPDEVSNDPWLSFSEIDNRTSLLRIRTFSSGAINRRGQDYYQFLETTFKSLDQTNTQNLILDLRGNGGGDDNYGAKLISYLSPEPFGYFESIEVTTNYSGYGSIEERDGKRYMISHQALNIQQPSPYHFKGKVYILIDGFSFSTCADVATVANHLDLATFVGEETGGGYDGNTSGYSEAYTLPNTGITIRIPRWMYTTANLGHKYYGRGVIPQYNIKPNLEDVLLGEDAIFSFTLEMISR